MDEQFRRIEAQYMTPTEYEAPEEKLICDWCECEVESLEGILMSGADGNYHGVCRECLKAAATVENALAYSDSVYGKDAYEDTFIAELYSKEALVSLARKDLTARIEAGIGIDIAHLKKAAERYCMFDDNGFIDFINRRE